MIIICSILAYATIAAFVGRYVFHHMVNSTREARDDCALVGALAGTFWPLAGPVFIGLRAATKTYEAVNKE